MKESIIRKKVDSIFKSILLDLGPDDAVYSKGVKIDCPKHNGYYSIAKTQTMVFISDFWTTWSLHFEFNSLEIFTYRFPEVFLATNVIKDRSISVAFNVKNASEAVDPKYLSGAFLKFDRTEGGLEEFDSYSRLLLQSTFLPMVDKFPNIHYLDKYFNTIRKPDFSMPNMRPSGTVSSGQMKRIIISKLAGTENWKWLLEDLETDVAYYRSLIGTEKGSNLDLYDKFPPILEEFKEYIQDLQPLKNPNLFSEENTIS